MFDFLKSSKHGGLETYLERIQMNMENNYKDAAQMNLNEMEELFQQLSEAGKLNEGICECHRAEYEQQHLCQGIYDKAHLALEEKVAAQQHREHDAQNYYQMGKNAGEKVHPHASRFHFTIIIIIVYYSFLFC